MTTTDTTAGVELPRVGQRMRTPFDPAGIVEVLEIESGLFCGKRTVMVRFIGDHPMGYKDGTIGRYFAQELRAVEALEKK